MLRGRFTAFHADGLQAFAGDAFAVPGGAVGDGNAGAEVALDDLVDFPHLGGEITLAAAVAPFHPAIAHGDAVIRHELDLPRVFLASNQGVDPFGQRAVYSRIDAHHHMGFLYDLFQGHFGEPFHLAKSIALIEVGENLAGHDDSHGGGVAGSGGIALILDPEEFGILPFHLFQQLHDLVFRGVRGLGNAFFLAGGKSFLACRVHFLFAVGGRSFLFRLAFLDFGGLFFFLLFGPVKGCVKGCVKKKLLQRRHVRGFHSAG